MTREGHVRICGRLGAKSPGPTRRSKGVTLDHVMWGLERRVQTNLLMTYRNTTRMTSKPELVTCSGNSVAETVRRQAFFLISDNQNSPWVFKVASAGQARSEALCCP